MAYGHSACDRARGGITTARLDKEKKARDLGLPQSDTLILGADDVDFSIEAVSRDDVVEDVHVQLPLVLGRQTGHVVRVEEVTG